MDEFINTKARSVRRKPCPGCTPGMDHGWWQRGYVGDKPAFRCINCNHTEVFPARSRAKVATAPSKAQKDAFDHIRRFFENRAGYNRVVREFKTTPSGYDRTFYVVVRTEGSIYTSCGGHFRVGARGSITVEGVYDLCDNSKERAQQYATLLYGKVGKHI